MVLDVPSPCTWGVLVLEGRAEDVSCGASSHPHGGGKHGRDTAQAHECGRNAMAAGVQSTQHAATCGQLCLKGKAAQAGSGGQVLDGHGDKKKECPQLCPHCFFAVLR